MPRSTSAGGLLRLIVGIDPPVSYPAPPAAPTVANAVRDLLLPTSLPCSPYFTWARDSVMQRFAQALGKRLHHETLVDSKPRAPVPQTHSSCRPNCGDRLAHPSATPLARRARVGTDPWPDRRGRAPHRRCPAGALLSDAASRGVAPRRRAVAAARARLAATQRAPNGCTKPRCSACGPARLVIDCVAGDTHALSRAATTAGRPPPRLAPWSSGREGGAACTTSPRHGCC